MENKALEKFRTAGKFDSQQECKYFQSMSGESLLENIDITPNALVSIALMKPKDIEMIKKEYERVDFLIDSGVFSWLGKAAKKMGITMQEAHKLSPTQIDGFEEKIKEYIAIMTELEPYSWGYIEIDIGNSEEKTETRNRLEKEGLRPMPVFKFADGIEYFRYLCETYDRICIGALVGENKTRVIKALVSVYEIARETNTWIHLLGYTPDYRLFSLLGKWSCDTSNYSTATRFARLNVMSGGYRTNELGREFIYDKRRIDKAEQYKKTHRLAIYNETMNDMVWRAKEEDERSIYEEIKETD